jgi:hypothetical protein
MRKANAGLWFVLVSLGNLGATRAGAQNIAPGLAVGIGVPIGDLGRERLPGPVVQTYAVLGERNRIARLQIGAEGAWFPGNAAAPAIASSAYGDLRVFSILGSVLIAPRSSGMKPYVTLGGGVQWLSVENRVNPYGSIVGVRSGLGVESPWGRKTFRAEISAHAILSDFATGKDWGMAAYIPFTFAIQF